MSESEETAQGFALAVDVTKSGQWLIVSRLEGDKLLMVKEQSLFVVERA